MIKMIFLQFNVEENDTYFHMHINGAMEEARKMAESLHGNPDKDLYVYLHGNYSICKELYVATFGQMCVAMVF